MSFSDIFLKKIANDEIDISIISEKYKFLLAKRDVNVKKFIADEIHRDVRTLNKFMTVLGISKIDLIPPTKIYLNRYNVFGCPDSTDLDVAFTVDSQDIVIAYQTNKHNFELILPPILNPENKDVDIVLIYINPDSGNLSTTSAGNKETQNIIWKTYHHHAQEYPCFFSGMVEVDIIDKIRAIAKFTMDHLQELLGDDKYALIRETKKRVYSSELNRQEFVNEQLKNLKVIINDKNISVYKSLTMKLIQCFTESMHTYIYEKKRLAVFMNDHIPNSAKYLEYLLFRGKTGEFNEIHTNDVFRRLVDEYIDIQMNQELEWKIIEAPISSNPTSLSDECFREFISSPMKGTSLFWSLFGDCENINKRFILDCFGKEHMKDSDAEKCIWIPQRCDEWLTKVKVPQNLSDDQYNLIRGAIMKKIVISNVDFTTLLGEPINKISTGFVIGDDGLIAPDLLLTTSDKKIIVVEIKTLSTKNTADVRRAIKLAKMQLKSCVRVFGECMCLIVLVYVDDMTIHIAKI
jgi:hypothetical protein